MTRGIRYGGAEHQSREIHASDEHHAEGWSFYGNGETVLVVRKCAKRGRPICDVIGENGLDEFGEPFVYTHYFLPVA